MLGDPFEGSANKKILDVLDLDFAAHFPDATKNVIQNMSREAFKGFLQMQKISACVSCWRCDDNESMAMWRAYGRSDYSVAIKSRYDIFRDLLPSNILLGCVKYVEFPDKEKMEHNSFYYSSRKHIGFQFEKEVRAIFLHGEIIKRVMESSQFVEGRIIQNRQAEMKKGEGIEIDVNALILEIVSNPVCPEWFIVDLERLCRKYGYNNRINRSTLDARTWNLL